MPWKAVAHLSYLSLDVPAVQPQICLHAGVRGWGCQTCLTAPVGPFAAVIQCAVTALCWASKENKYF